MKRNLINAIMIMILLHNISCDRDESIVHIDPLLTDYIDRFYEEGEKRAVDLDRSDPRLSAYLESLTSDEVLGQCITYTDGTRAVRIDENYWSTLTDLDKEYIVFHELGHCLLNRAHNNSFGTGRSCASIMQSGDAVCQVRYSVVNRDELLDELFSN